MKAHVISTQGWIVLMAVAWGILLLIDAPWWLWLAASAYCILQADEAPKRQR